MPLSLSRAPYLLPVLSHSVPLARIRLSFSLCFVLCFYGPSTLTDPDDEMVTQV